MSEVGDAQETSVCMGWDAFRIAVGKKPRRFSRREVMRWLRLMNEQAKEKQNAK